VSGVDVAVQVIRIPEQPGLDPITVFAEDFAPGRGRITIVCYTESWTAGWGGMGPRSVRDFVASVNVEYLSDCLTSPSHLDIKKSRQPYHLRYMEKVASAVIAAFGGSDEK
jgi:hypothetical protein